MTGRAPVCDSLRGINYRSRAPATVRAVATAWRSWLEWRTATCSTFTTATAGDAAGWITATAARTSGSTADRYRWRLVTAADAAGLETLGRAMRSPEARAAAADGLRADRRAGRWPRQAAPLTGEMAEALIASLDGPLAARDEALVRIGRATAARADELARVLVGHVERHHRDASRAVVTITAVKTDPYARRPHRVTLDVLTTAAVRRVAAGGNPAERLLGLGSAQTVSQRLRLLGHRAGIEGLTGHSLRRGVAVDLAAGYDMATVAKVGRWTSPEQAAVYAYGHGAVWELPEALADEISAVLNPGPSRLDNRPHPR